MNELFALRGEVSSKTKIILTSAGLVFLVSMWQALCSFEIFPAALLPAPMKVLSSLPELVGDNLAGACIYSIKLNLLGYVLAIIIALPVGFALGLFPLFREMFSKVIDAGRFLPLTAVTGLFIAWFGIEDTMKVNFLAFGILLYLIPVVINRINDVDQVYLDTATTLGFSTWKKIHKIFFPAVFSKVFDDIRVIVAISWTYIIIAEVLNKTNGIGALIATVARQSRIDKVFMLLFVIILIGLVQDRLFKLLDYFLFPHKYRSEE